MSRWKAGARRKKQGGGAEDVCASCRTQADAGASLTVDSNDGRAYCESCWRAYYGRPPEVSGGHADAAGRDQVATRPSQSGFWDEEPIAGSGGLAEGRAEVAVATDGRARPRGRKPPAEEPAGAAAGPAEAAAAPATARARGRAPAVGEVSAAQEGPSAAPASVAESGAQDPKEAAPHRPLASSSAEPQPPAPAEHRGRSALSRFWQEVAELRRAYAEERSEDADALQREELEALEAIYGEALQLLSEGAGGPRTLRLELPTEAVGKDGVELLVGTAEGTVPVGRVAALPPVALLCALPGGYPASGARPLAMALDAEHLGSGFLGKLEKELREVAERLAGEAALFELSSALQAGLAPPEQLELGEDGDGAMEVAIGLLAHDRRVRDERRQRELQTCPVCLDSVIGARGIFLSCDHFACQECLGQMVQLHVTEGDSEALRCFVPDCRRPFGPDVIREAAGPDSGALAEKWDDLALRRCLEEMRDVVFCPRCDADGDGRRSACIEDEDHMARCGVCGFVFCGRCKGVFHPGVECSGTDGRMAALEARARGQGPEAAAARSELLTLRHLAATTKSCPRCQTAIEKSEGCSKVRCGNCHAYFCWRCNKEITGYDHFAKSECRLFDDDEIRRWNQRMHAVDRQQARAHEARFLAQFVDPSELWQQARECPRCRSVVVREGKNNHMRCHGCQSHFCGRCLTALPKNRASEHFGKGRACPQHSDD